MNAFQERVQQAAVELAEIMSGEREFPPTDPEDDMEQPDALDEHVSAMYRLQSAVNEIEWKMLPARKHNTVLAGMYEAMRTLRTLQDRMRRFKENT